MDLNRKDALEHYNGVLAQARAPAIFGLPEPKASLPYDAECVVHLLGTQWIADIRFDACSDGDGWLLEELDVLLSPANVAFQSDCGGYRVDFTELSEDAQSRIEEACEKAFAAETESHAYEADFIEDIS